MEYIYAAMLIHKAGGKIEDATVKKVLEAAGITVDETRVKALVAALDGVNIEDAIKNAAPVAVAAGPAAAAPAEATPKEEKKEEKPKEDPNAAAGLGALFG
ncbi:MAG: large subunit ribosomal protein L12 [Candidatus Woesearchaeota archaeon]|jgi:large subunit ribosomal protein L12